VIRFWISFTLITTGLLGAHYKVALSHVEFKESFKTLKKNHPNDTFVSLGHPDIYQGNAALIALKMGYIDGATVPSQTLYKLFPELVHDRDISIKTLKGHLAKVGFYLYDINIKKQTAFITTKPFK